MNLFLWAAGFDASFIIGASPSKPHIAVYPEILVLKTFRKKIKNILWLRMAYENITHGAIYCHGMAMRGSVIRAAQEFKYVAKVAPAQPGLTVKMSSR